MEYYNGMTPEQNALKECGGSGCFLGAAVAYTVSLAAYAWQITAGRMGAASLWQDVAGELAGTVISVLSFFLMLLIGVGLWQFYAGCRREGAPAGGGLSLIRGTLILLLTLGCAAGVLIAALLIMAGARWGMNGYLSYTFRMYGYRLDAETARILLPVFAGVVIVVLVVLLVYMAGMIRNVSAAIHICRTGWPHKKLSVFAAVINFAVAVFMMSECFSASVQLIGGLGSFWSLDLLIQSLATMIFSLLTGILILRLRGRLIEGR